MRQAFQLRPGTIFTARKPVRNAAYLRFVKGFACAACGSTRLVDPAHSGDHGLGSKSSDFSAIPLCRSCHAAFDEDPKGFALLHDLDVAALIRKFNRLWEERQRRTA